MPALPPYIIEPIWQQFAALLPEREVDHPLGCHRPRIPDRVVFEKLIQVLVFGCAYHRIADKGCSATTLRERRDEWIGLGVIDALREAVLEAYDRFIGLELSEVAVDCCITKACLRPRLPSLLKALHPLHLSACQRCQGGSCCRGGCTARARGSVPARP